MTREREAEIEEIVFKFEEITQDEMRELKTGDCYNIYAVANNQLIEAMQVCRERGIKI